MKQIQAKNSSLNYLAIRSIVTLFFILTSSTQCSIHQFPNMQPNTHPNKQPWNKLDKRSMSYIKRKRASTLLRTQVSTLFRTIEPVVFSLILIAPSILIVTGIGMLTMQAARGEVEMRKREQMEKENVKMKNKIRELEKATLVSKNKPYLT